MVKDDRKKRVPAAKASSREGKTSVSGKPLVAAVAPAAKAALARSQKEYLYSQRVAANFGNIVTILMQSPAHREHKLGDLHELVVPPLVANQFRIAEAHKKSSGYAVPVGVILWAKVSDTIDKRLGDAANKSVSLAAKDWTSGEHIWIIEAVGADRFISPLLADLRKKELKGKTIKFRANTKKGVVVRTL